MNRIFFIMGLIVFTYGLYAKDTPIISNRPSFTTGTNTVKPNNVIVEFGYQYAFDSIETNSSTSTAPLLDLRVGVTSKFELAIFWSGWEISQVKNQPSESSSSDVSLGSKYRLVKSDLYNVTLLGILSFSTESNSTTSHHSDPTVGLLWDYALSKESSIFGTLQAKSYIVGDNREYDFQPAVGLSFSHKHGLSTFIEYFSNVPLQSKEGKQHTIDAGLSYLLNNDIQWDVNFAVGLNAISENYVGSGFAFRF